MGSRQQPPSLSLDYFSSPSPLGLLQVSALATRSFSCVPLAYTQRLIGTPVAVPLLGNGFVRSRCVRVRTAPLLSLRGRRLASRLMLLRHLRPLHHVRSRRPSTGRPALIQPCLPPA